MTLVFACSLFSCRCILLYPPLCKVLSATNLSFITVSCLLQIKLGVLITLKCLLLDVTISFGLFHYKWILFSSSDEKMAHAFFSAILIFTTGYYWTTCPFEYVLHLRVNTLIQFVRRTEVNKKPKQIVLSSQTRNMTSCVCNSLTLVLLLFLMSSMRFPRTFCLWVLPS